MAAACFRISKDLATISEGVLPESCARSPSRAAARPSPVSNSPAIAFINSVALASCLAPMTAFALAMLSLRVPQSPLGSAAVTASPAMIALSSSVFHSSAVKSVLPAINFPPMPAPYCALLIFQNRDAERRLSAPEALQVLRPTLIARAGQRQEAAADKRAKPSADRVTWTAPGSGIAAVRVIHMRASGLFHSFRPL